jgi:chaperonin GroES
MITPAQEKILVRRDEADEKTKSGLFKPEGALEKPQTGVVVAVGPGKYVEGTFPLVRIPSDYAVGDTVYFGKYAGSEVEIADETLLILSYGDILGKENK